jgi:hypothetical protein
MEWMPRRRLGIRQSQHLFKAADLGFRPGERRESDTRDAEQNNCQQRWAQH